ncbi:MAG: orotate phosphoribosyltransferase [Candidatus Krumholzibacteria bacterium]|jgi:orotate phosphoribosyltransferase|nr:orotate phosphoribosyltransferase [Candidatus Krumholzibacteria bacterium]MDP6669382.1 orotate phosphoribosyltransferase [Candidatus Krumholzibacteria bacterium]MDP6797204.1 orotate phosphoribosyltransferase [Candidatus Krumholzibacteria bacterium]MDP7022497.1 orotate phosphoribosyltransferase [Candidatus Krumholzibacteria bacterium]
MKEEVILSALRETGAMLEGHFLLSSGLHSDRYFQCARLLARTDYAALCGRAIAEKLTDKPDLVISPAMGGIVIGHEVARTLGIPFLFTEREEGKMKLRRFDWPRGARVAIVEDVVTSGGSLIETAELVRHHGCEVMATAAIVDRSGDRSPDFGAPFLSLLQAEVKTWDEAQCPLCAAGSEAVKPGSRDLLERKG